MEKNTIRPIYSELQGFLAEAPKPEKVYETTDDEALWNRFNQIIDELASVSGADYSRYKIQPTRHGDRRYFIEISELRSKLAQVIARLHGEYFFEELAPFSGMPNTSINVHQSQSQNQSIQMMMEFYDAVVSKIETVKEPKEKTFLEGLKTGLRNVTNFAQLASAIASSAQAAGLAVSDLVRLFR